ncbi:MAG: hypothetical protein EA404_00140 [Spirochaetaceae bacterium]|nr:MAG: hypothetical protein EA404_00140 [Spirochaetaceae bacterium]
MTHLDLTTEDLQINRQLARRFNIWDSLDYNGTARQAQISEQARATTARRLQGQVPPTITCTDWDHTI